MRILGKLHDVLVKPKHDWVCVKHDLLTLDVRLECQRCRIECDTNVFDDTRAVRQWKEAGMPTIGGY